MIAIGIMCHATVGGSARVATHLAGVLAAKGYQVKVLASRRPAFPLPPEVEVRAVRDDPPGPRDRLAVTAGRADLEALIDLATGAVRAEKIDLLHYHYALPFAAVAREVRARSRNGLRVVGTLHGTDVSVHGAQRATRLRLLRDLNTADALTTVSRSHATLIRRQLGHDPIVIPNFVDLDAFSPAASQHASRPRILHMSNFRPVKNTVEVARAFAHLCARRDAELWLVGDGETLPDTLRELRRRGVPEAAVRWFGMVYNPAAIIAKADVLVVPSHCESFSLAALEAMACGVPVVGTRVGGLAELVDGRGCGVLVDPDDEGGLVLAIEQALEMRAELRAGAMRRAAEFSVEAVVPRYEQLYRRVLAGVRTAVTAGQEQPRS